LETDALQIRPAARQRTCLDCGRSGLESEQITRGLLPSVTRAAVLVASVAALLFAFQVFAQVTTSQYDNARTGANLSETVLTPQNVNPSQFGKLFSLPVDGDIYAQPLYLPQLDIPGKGKHNVVFVATEHDSVYAFDADAASSAALWQVNFLSPEHGVTTVPARDVRCPFIRPEVGITCTPVIDRVTKTIYVLGRTKEADGSSQARYIQRLHALDVATGAEKFGGPVVIQATVKGKGKGTSNGEVSFDPLLENPRAGLLLVGGRIYVAWASSCDVGPYHGWVMAYDARTLAQVAVFNTSPDADEGGIWQGDVAPAADSQGDVFVVTGNGAFDASSGGRDYGDTILKLGVDHNNFVVRDYFTPSDQAGLNEKDLDLGSGGPILIPDQPGPHPHLLIVAGKGGGLYVVDRDRMGKFNQPNNIHAVQVLQLKNPPADSGFGAPAYWNHRLYLLLSNDVLKVFALDRGQLSREPVAQAATRFIDPGAIPTVSSNGTRDGIVWVIETKGWRAPDRPAVLHAYDAMNVARELYNSEQNSARDRAGMTLRFTIPTVINGRVYVEAKKELDVYGLVPPQ
jgi:hypothetical protein